MPNDPKTNEWNLLKQQFDALLHDENVSADSIEEVLDVEFPGRQLVRQQRQQLGM